jgi:hypothetical protein
MHDKTLKLVTNLDRGGIESRIAEVRKAAQAANLSDVVNLLNGAEGKPRADLEQRVRGSLKLLANKSEHKNLFAQLELIELNLPNLK